MIGTYFRILSFGLSGYWKRAARLPRRNCRGGYIARNHISGRRRIRSGADAAGIGQDGKPGRVHLCANHVPGDRGGPDCRSARHICCKEAGKADAANAEVEPGRASNPLYCKSFLQTAMWRRFRARPSAPPANAPGGGAEDSAAETLIAVAVQVSANNDVLLDNGAQVEITLGAPLSWTRRRWRRRFRFRARPCLGNSNPQRFADRFPVRRGLRGRRIRDSRLSRNSRHCDSGWAGDAGHGDSRNAGDAQHHHSRLAGNTRHAGNPCPGPPIVISSTPRSQCARQPAKQIKAAAGFTPRHSSSSHLLTGIRKGIN